MHFNQINLQKYFNISFRLTYKKLVFFKFFIIKKGSRKSEMAFQDKRITHFSLRKNWFSEGHFDRLSVSDSHNFKK